MFTCTNVCYSIRPSICNMTEFSISISFATEKICLLHHLLLWISHHQMIMPSVSDDIVSLEPVLNTSLVALDEELQNLLQILLQYHVQPIVHQYQYPHLVLENLSDLIHHLVQYLFHQFVKLILHRYQSYQRYVYF